MPDAQIDFVLRKGNESLLEGNPNIRHVFVWNKQEKKYSNLFDVIREVKKNKYDAVLNLQRFASTGFITWRSKAEKKIGFRKNPLSLFFDVKTEHEVDKGKHEIERNFDLLKSVGNFELCKPRLYPNQKDVEQIEALNITSKYVVMAPASVWFTKQLPMQKWVELIQKIPTDYSIYLIGGKADENLLNNIITQSGAKNVYNVAGKLSLLASAHLMKNAKRTYVNDSAPMHLASSVNAPVTVFYCSTVPAFGFGPLSDQSTIVEVSEKLECRPCGLHGFMSCPKGHFDCGNKIVVIP